MSNKSPASAATVKITPSVYGQPGYQNRCHSCSTPADYDDIKSLHYVRADGVPGSSYPMCGRCRPERIARLARMGFVQIEAR